MSFGAVSSRSPATQPFWYWDKGELAIVGRAYAVADLRSHGLPASRHGWSGRVCISTFLSDLRIGCSSSAMGPYFPDKTSPRSSTS